MNSHPILKATFSCLLLSMWPAASYLASNMKNGLTVAYMLPIIMAVCLASCLVVLAIVKTIRQDKHAQAIYSWGAAVALFFCYGIVHDFLDGYDLGRFRFIFPIWFGLFCVGVVLVWKLSFRPEGKRALFWGAAALIALPTWQIASQSLALTSSARNFDGQQPTSGYDQTISDEAAEDMPSVFFIVLDAYSRADILQSELGFDNSLFLNELKDNGFFIADRSRVNYTATLLSLSSTLSMNYHFKSGELSNLATLAQVIQGHNEVTRQFDALGYTYAKATPSHWFASKCSNVEDICISPAGMSEHYRDLMAMAPVEHFMLMVAPKLLQDLFNLGDVTLFDVSERLGQVRTTPLFLFAHMLIPHAPYRYTPECEYLPPNQSGTYLDNLHCANKQVLEFVRWVDNHHPNAIIVIQSDHGIGNFTGTSPGKDWLYPGLTEQQFDIKAANLNVWRLPEDCKPMLRNDLTSINTFRIVFACIHGTAPEMLGDEFFVSNYKSMLIRPLRE